MVESIKFYEMYSVEMLLIEEVKDQKVRTAFLRSTNKDRTFESTEPIDQLQSL